VQQPQADSVAQTGLERVRFITFTKVVKTLECEIQWGSRAHGIRFMGLQCPIVVQVVPNGAADCHGMRAGDRILEINNMETEGLSRQQLLPILQQRPLTLKLESKSPLVMTTGDQISMINTISMSPRTSEDTAIQAGSERIRFTTFTEADGTLQCKVQWDQPAPIVVELAPDGGAQRHGISAGDLILEVNGIETEGLSREQLLPLLQQRPLTLKLESDPYFFHNKLRYEQSEVMQIASIVELQRSLLMKEGDDISEMSTHTLSDTGAFQLSDAEDSDAQSRSSESLACDHSNAKDIVDVAQGLNRFYMPIW